MTNATQLEMMHVSDMRASARRWRGQDFEAWTLNMSPREIIPLFDRIDELINEIDRLRNKLYITSDDIHTSPAETVYRW